MEAATRNEYKPSWLHEDMIVELSKGFQVTIPAEVRNELNLKPGSTFTLEVQGRKTIILSRLAISWDEYWKEVDAEIVPCEYTPEELDDFSQLH